MSSLHSLKQGRWIEISKMFHSASLASRCWRRTIHLTGLSAWHVATLIFLCVAQNVCHADQLEARYLLGPLDLVRVKVFEWQAARDDVFEWKALNDQFVIRAEARYRCRSLVK